MNIEIYGKTDPGLIRENNEDTYFLNSELGYCLVADGMGGAAAGEIASGIFSGTAKNVFSSLQKQSEESAVEMVQKIFLTANDAILDNVKKHPENKGMGCTAELIVFYNEGFVIGHMGDSRSYRFRNGQMKQLTKDHSLVQDQLDQGLISPEEARNHSMRNVILRAVGIKKNPALDILRGKLYPGDLFLLCSDGLTDLVDDDLITDQLKEMKDLSTGTEKLIEMAKSAGGRDNITVVLTRIL